MKAGKLEIHLLSDGLFKLDGGALFGQVPRVLWERAVKPDKSNRVALGLNCILIRSPDGNILVDTGAGGKHDERTQKNFGLKCAKLLRDLRSLGVAPQEIKWVVFSHLHFDHAGGATRFNRRHAVVPTFPKATYLVQEAAWEDAMSPNERGHASYRKDDLLPLWEKKLVKLLPGDYDLAPGIRLKVTGGHCKGHQMLLINHASAKVAFLGDLIPTPHHLQLAYISALDQYPEETLEKKRELLSMLEREGWLVVFSHGYEHRSGIIERRDGRFMLRPVEL